MGQKFANVQLRAEGQAAAELHARVLDVVRDPAACADLRLAERWVLVSPPRRSGWISVYDELLESFDAAAMDALGKLLAARLAASAVTVSYFDDDVVELRL